MAEEKGYIESLFVRRLVLEIYQDLLNELRRDCLANGEILMSHKTTIQSIRKGWIEFATDIQHQIETLNTILE